MSISPTIFEQLFWQKLFCSAFLFSQFGFDIFWQKNIGTKDTCKMLVKLIPDLFHLDVQQKGLIRLMYAIKRKLGWIKKSILSTLAQIMDMESRTTIKQWFRF